MEFRVKSYLFIDNFCSFKSLGQILFKWGLAVPTELNEQDFAASKADPREISIV